ncbi:hypothetical protein COU20_02635 [Candidatus Kaiserbacteria bacterium CG10_big_fil_rev_8_21_14_0_10_59_10]|uniref:Uncharacterized protein n=1 Tax=Candidatus Kaiserbacteria bacterium CG10_big_fil_rev_8_21_14_0_10_59_10 TaxID=1974612 RepID=A0A2H0U9F1_9BACT|nr:MAG: hypothetical protein COU20_02635 [Candidatus Kaiserbacteria bacterium CG10_big_fil_rev_8_21_14_0_10_59_10]
MTRAWTIIIALLIVVVGGGIYFTSQVAEERNGVPEEPVAEEEWALFTNEVYGFEFRYPAQWRTASSTEFEPIFNAYSPLPAGSAETPPFIHHHNVTNVSVFPMGVPTEGLFASSQPVNFPVGFPIAPGSMMFTLADGTPFAAYLVPVSRPQSWGEAGFVWIRARIEGAETRCFSGEEELSMEECDPLGTDHRIEWYGDVSAQEWNELLTVVRDMELR